MAAINANLSVAEILRGHPGAVRTFESFGIDYCCGGGRALGDACARVGVDVAAVVQRLEREDGLSAARSHATSFDASFASLPELCDHIVSAHHSFTTREGVRLPTLADTVASRHGARSPMLLTLAATVRELFSDLSIHMQKEERVLFPTIRAIANSSKETAAASLPALVHPIRVMLREHVEAGDQLRKVRELTNNFVAPEDACTKWRTLYEGLREHERDLMWHVHLENDVLFRRVQELQSQAGAACVRVSSND